jgi:hypothetical protein
VFELLPQRIRCELGNLIQLHHKAVLYVDLHGCLPCA